MQQLIQNLINFIYDNLGRDRAVIGLSGINKKYELSFVHIPKEYKKCRIQNIERNYLLIK